MKTVSVNTLKLCAHSLPLKGAKPITSNTFKDSSEITPSLDWIVDNFLVFHWDWVARETLTPKYLSVYKNLTERYVKKIKRFRFIWKFFPNLKKANDEEMVLTIAFVWFHCYKADQA
jgi:hypothetical protein